MTKTIFTLILIIIAFVLIGCNNTEQSKEELSDGISYSLPEEPKNDSIVSEIKQFQNTDIDSVVVTVAKSDSIDSLLESVNKKSYPKNIYIKDTPEHDSVDAIMYKSKEKEFNKRKVQADSIDNNLDRIEKKLQMLEEKLYKKK